MVEVLNNPTDELMVPLLVETLKHTQLVDIPNEKLIKFQASQNIYPKRKSKKVMNLAQVILLENRT